MLASIYAKKPDVNLGSIFLQVIEEVGQDIRSVPDDEILKVLRKIKDQDGSADYDSVITKKFEPMLGEKSDEGFNRQ